jgi:hypothetical protein
MHSFDLEIFSSKVTKIDIQLRRLHFRIFFFINKRFLCSANLVCVMLLPLSFCNYNSFQARFEQKRRLLIARDETAQNKR